MQVNDVQIHHAAGLVGTGLVQAGYTTLVPHIQSDALVRMLPHLRPRPLPASFVVTHRRNLSPHVRVFMAWIEGLLKPYLDRAPLGRRHHPSLA